MRPDAVSARSSFYAPKARRGREVRDPYDGLRPWSAITHGVGAALSLLGAALLLLQAAARRSPLLAAVWSLALAGVVLTIAKLDIPRWLTSGLDLFLGWLALTAILPLSRLLPAEGMAWLLSGGLLYTLGGVLYAVKWPGRNNPRFGCHEIFHVFILLGSLCHFLLMYRVIARL